MAPRRAWLLAALAWGLVVGEAAAEAHGSTNAAQKGCDDDGHEGERQHFRGITDNFMTKAGATVDNVLRPCLLNRGTTLVAFIAVIALHCLRLAGFADWPNWHTFAVHCIVLNIFYSVHSTTVALDVIVRTHCPFMASVAFLTLDAIMHAVVAGRLTSKKKQVVREAKVVSRYMQVASPFTHATLVFMGQFFLMMLFIYSLNRDQEMKQACNVSFVKWVVASIITIVAGQAEVGMEYNPRFWYMLLEKEQAQKEGRVLCNLKAPNWAVWKVRWSYSFLVNNVFRMLILGLCPIMLCVSDSMEFIKDCLALFFITKLDDVADGRTIDDELRLWEEREKKEYDMLHDVEEAEQEAVQDGTQSSLLLNQTTGAAEEEAEVKHNSRDQKA